MAHNLSVGIDIGTHQLKAVAVEDRPTSDLPKIRGTGFAESAGLRHGYAIDVPAVTERVEEAIQQTSESAGQNIENTHLAIGGASLQGHRSTGSISFNNENHEITEGDVDAVLEASQDVLIQKHQKNRTVLHRFPLAFKVDGRTTHGQPNGLVGQKLSVHTFFITSISQHIYDLVEAVENAGINVDDIIASPLAASEVTLTNAQKKAGCVLANIGSETVSVIVFDDGRPVSLTVFPIGSTDITNDIALGLKVPLEKAEQIKLGGITGSDVSKKKLEEIMAARLTDIFELIEDHLKSINREGLLPAGIIMTGGGSSLSMVEDIAKSTLELPSEVAHVKLPKTKVIRELENSSWTVAYGTAARALRNRQTGMFSSIRNSQNAILDWLKQFLP